MFRSFLVFVVIASLPAAALSVGGPPLPPLGWEESVTPGFDPPIEETLVFAFHAEGPKRKEFADAWGAQAVPVLSRLQADPKWSKYKGVIQAYITLLGGAVPVERLEQQVRDAFETMAGGKRVEDADLKAIYQIAGDATDEMREIVRAAYAAADEENQSRMTHYLSLFAGEERISFFETCIPLSKGERNRESLERYIFEERGRLRAREPMSAILTADRVKETDQ